MAFSLIWLPDVLQDAGLKVSLVDGWRNRGFENRDIGTVMGVICHHTAGRMEGNMPSLRTLIKGTDKVPPPLSQLGLARDGTYFVVAAGLCNHAGRGEWQGITRGNTHFIGIEAENTGSPKKKPHLRDPWPAVQLDAYERGVAAILTHIRASPIMCCGHKEWAPSRKPDPALIDMPSFRLRVDAIMKGVAPRPRPPIPAQDTKGRPTLRRPSEGDLVKKIQTLLGVEVDGDFGPKTEAAVRQFQRDKGLVPDGIVGPLTWAALLGDS